MTMTKKQALREFREMYPGGEAFKLPDNPRRVDDVARREAWNNFTDALCKDGRITLKQYESWTHPF